MTTRTITIPANGSSTQRVAGRYFWCYTATAAFSVIAWGERSLDANQGFGPTASRFNQVVFVNSSATNIDVSFAVDDSPIQVNSQTVTTSAVVTTSGKDGESYTKATSCPANATTTFNGSDGAYKRKQFCVWNDNAAGGANITIMDNLGTAGFKVAPQSGFTMPTNGIFKVNVPAGSNPALVMETFYL